MNINPNTFSKNAFNGRIHLDNLQHFFKIFFPSKFEKLKMLTPPSVREQPFFNNYLDMTYEPKNVTVNGVELVGAFQFEGLVNFHGLLSTVRIVMDPS